jgi:LuxR family transcriptional regulator, maltose regulon positive regulatory protein
MNQPDALLATKLHIPRVRPGSVLRARLMRQLTAGLDHDLTLVVAPAGYGKSIAVTQWAASIAAAVAWLSLDAADNDPVRFWRHVLAALSSVRPGIAERVGPLAGPPPPPSFDGLTTALINDVVADRPGPTDPARSGVVLVLDDYHLIDNEAVHASLRFLLQHRPSQLHVVVAGRADPPLGLAQLRARGQLKELRVADLRFNVEEAAELLAQTDAGREQPLTPAAVAALAARTEGWAAGLQLAALSLREQTDVDGFVTAFTGSHRYVLDYLTEEVLERQASDVREFLLETSVLERLSGSLCDAVTGRRDSQRLLEQVDRSGLFLVQLDDSRGWWRYHHLFADLLRVRLAQDPNRARELHRRAASWYRARGLNDDTIHHAVQAGDLGWAARLMEEHFDTVFNLRGEQATIQSWLPALPEEVVRSRPRLLLAQAQMASMRGDLRTMEPLLDAAEQVAHATEDESFEPTTGRSGSLLVNVPAMIALQRSYAAQLRGQPDATAAFAQRALEHLGPDELMLSSAVEGFFAVAEWLEGRLPEAEEAFESRIGWWRREGQVTTTAWGYYSLARLQRAQGRLDAAVSTCRRALEAATPSDQSDSPAAGPALVGLAAVSYQRNELAAALDYVSRGITLCRQFVHTPPLAAGLATLAWIRWESGDREGALDAMEEAGHFSPGPAGLLNPVPVQRARLMLACGEVAEAAGWVRGSVVHAGDELRYPREPEHLVLVRVLLAEGRADGALLLLEGLDAAADRQHRPGSLIEIRTLRALALMAVGDEAGALASLTSALALGCPQRYVRVFVDEGGAIAGLLGRLVSQRSGRRNDGVPLGCIARIQAAFPPTSPSQPHVSLVEPLTAREREILRLLAAGATNRAIADELVVTVDTVKKHVSHVLGKLGAANRTEAVARGRELEALDPLP